MKSALGVILFGLVLGGCVSGPPARGPAYWASFVETQQPASDADGNFYAQGEVERDVALDEGRAFRFKFIETVNRAPIWVLQIDNDRSGYFIFTESWIDGAIPRNRQRKVEFTLDESEYTRIRQVIRDSGFLSVRSGFTGSGDTDWSVGVGVSEDVKLVSFEGAYPNEARKAVYGVYDIVVKPRSTEMEHAKVFDPDDWQHAPEYQPLR